MRPPPFILVRKSNVPGPGETAGYRDETMFFREFNFGTRMEHMRLSGRRLLSSLVTHKGRIAAVFWFVGYTAALHPDRLTRGRTEAIQWDSPPWCVMHRSIFFFPQKKWVRASARKKAFGGRLQQAKRSACPTRGWVKSPSTSCWQRPKVVFRTAGRCRGKQGHRGVSVSTAEA